MTTVIVMTFKVMVTLAVEFLKGAVNVNKFWHKYQNIKSCLLIERIATCQKFWSISTK